MRERGESGRQQPPSARQPVSRRRDQTLQTWQLHNDAQSDISIVSRLQLQTTTTSKLGINSLIYLELPLENKDIKILTETDLQGWWSELSGLSPLSSLLVKRSEVRTELTEDRETRDISVQE